MRSQALASWDEASPVRDVSEALVWDTFNRYMLSIKILTLQSLVVTVYVTKLLSQ
jgi:hypothetical protein